MAYHSTTNHTGCGTVWTQEDCCGKTRNIISRFRRRQQEQEDASLKANQEPVLEVPYIGVGSQSTQSPSPSFPPGSEESLVGDVLIMSHSCLKMNYSHYSKVDSTKANQASSSSHREAKAIARP